MAVQYWGLAPEVNAIRLTTGPGAAALTPHVSGYTATGATHLSQAAQMGATAAASAAGWQGVGGSAMTAAVAKKMAWTGEAGAYANKSAALIGRAAAAHSTAVACTIPYPTVVANRIRQATLVATNIIGQNTPAIAEADAEYGEFWAQNASAMTAYQTEATGIMAGLSAPLRPPDPSVNIGGLAAGVAAVGAQAAATGVQGLSAGMSMPASAGAQVAGTAGAVSSAVPGAVSAATSATGSTASSSGSGTGSATPNAAPAGAPEAAPASEFLGTAQSLAGPAMQAPQALQGAVMAPLSQAGQIPGMAAGMMGPAMSAMSAGAPGGLSASSPGAQLASSMAGANGGYASGGSPVAAALTKSGGGAGPAGGPVGLPSAWFGANAASEGAGAAKSGAGPRPRTAAGPMMGPGLMGMPAAAAAANRGQTSTREQEADRTVMVPDADAVPVLTTEGLTYTDGGG